MSIEMSEKVILITDRPRITSPIKIALNKHNLEIVTDYPALTSTSVMSAGIAKSGKTAFIRTELLRFIRAKGFPRAIIMDSQIDLGREAGPDPGMLKIFKTFLIACVILSKGTEFKNIRGNFILLTKGNDFEKEFGIGNDPYSVMNLLSSQNPEINVFIDELKEKRELFDAIFSIELVDTGLSSDIITESIVNFLQKTAKGAISSPPAPDAAPAEKKTAKVEASDDDNSAESDDTPARIVYRINAESVYDDGKILTELTEEHAALKEKEFYIIGSWNSKTELEVSKKIASVVQKGINENARFGYGDPITFNFDDRCIIDKNTTLSIAQLFTKNLSVFKKITLAASPKNSELIQKSRGFPMIKDIFKIAEPA